MEEELHCMILRLQTGEDIISKFEFVPKDIEGEEDHFMVNDPFRIMYLNDPSTGKLIVTLVPWVFSSLTDDKVFKIYSSDVITAFSPKINILEYYMSMVERLRKVENDPVAKEISEMDSNENMLSDEEIFDLVKDKLNSIRKGTLH